MAIDQSALHRPSKGGSDRERPSGGTSHCVRRCCSMDHHHDSKRSRALRQLGDQPGNGLTGNSRPTDQVLQHDRHCDRSTQLSGHEPPQDPGGITYLAAQYARLKRRRGHKRATIAVAHSILVVPTTSLRVGSPAPTEALTTSWTASPARSTRTGWSASLSAWATRSTWSPPTRPDGPLQPCPREVMPLGPGAFFASVTFGAWSCRSRLQPGEQGSHLLAGHKQRLGGGGVAAQVGQHLHAEVEGDGGEGRVAAGEQLG
jgi:hypothetical protein